MLKHFSSASRLKIVFDALMHKSEKFRRLQAQVNFFAADYFTYSPQPVAKFLITVSKSIVPSVNAFICKSTTCVCMVR